MLRRRGIVLLLLVVSVLGLGIAVRYVPDLRWLVDQEQWLREKVNAAPVSSWLIGLTLYFLLSLVPGTAGKSVICGWIFGFWAAVIMVDLGLTAAAVVSFLVARYAISQLLHERWQAKLDQLSGWFEREGAFVLLTLRLTHAPFTLVNYASGATPIPLRTFWWTTHLGILPGTMVFTFAGTRIPSIGDVAAHGAWELLDPPLFFALLATAAMPFAVRVLLLPRISGSRRWKEWEEPAQ